MKRKINAVSIILLLIFFSLILTEVFHLFSSSFRFSVIISFGISVINFVIFALSFTYSVKKSNKTFLIFVLGGMIFRLFLVLLLVFLVLIYLKVDQYAFIFGLLIWYVFLLVFEIMIVKETLTKAKD